MSSVHTKVSKYKYIVFPIRKLMNKHKENISS